MSQSQDSTPGSTATLADAAADVLDRAERQATLTAAELSDLRRALQEVRRSSSGTPPPSPRRFDPDRLRDWVKILSGAASGAAAGAITGTLVGIVTGSLLFPGMGTIAGALIGASLSAGSGFERQKS